MEDNLDSYSSVQMWFRPTRQSIEERLLPHRKETNLHWGARNITRPTLRHKTNCLPLWLVFHQVSFLNYIVLFSFSSRMRRLPLRCAAGGMYLYNTKERRWKMSPKFWLWTLVWLVRAYSLVWLVSKCSVKHFIPGFELFTPENFLKV